MTFGVEYIINCVCFLRTLVSTTMSSHIGIARAHIFVPRCPRRHAVAPVAAGIACPYAHLMPRCLAASIITLAPAVWILIQHITLSYNI